MALSLVEFMENVSEIVIAHETAWAIKLNESRKEELKTLPAELAAQEKTLAELQAIVEQEKKKLQDAEKEGVDGIKDPFTVLKTWAEKRGAWKGWEGEVTGPKSLPPLGWVRRSRNLSLISFQQYESMHALVKRGKQAVLKAHLEHLQESLEKAQEKADKARQSYAFDRERFGRLQRQVESFDQELEQLREESTPRTQEDLEDLLEDAWEESSQREEILKLIPSENHTVEEELHLTSVTRNHTIRLVDATLHFETYFEPYS